MLLKDTVDYCGGAIVENGVLKKLLTPVGYVDMSGSTPSYYYYLKDHQVNNRVVVNSSGSVVETNHYYPFGGLFAANGSVQDYKYNGKELDDKTKWYNYGARHYDAMLGRFTTMDPLGEVNYSSGSYTYCLNNPIKYIDPTGCLESTHTDSIGNVVEVYNDGDLSVYRHDSDEEGTRKELEEKYSRDNTSGGGKWMGETYEWDSFINPNTGKPTGQIFYDRYIAGMEILDKILFLQQLPLPPTVRLGVYALNADNGGYFDIKDGREYDGSQLIKGKYLSMRDAGNMLAGMVARLNELPEIVTYTLFGAFNLGGNNIKKIPDNILEAIRKGSSGYYGELPISHKFQNRGYNFKIW